MGILDGMAFVGDDETVRWRSVIAYADALLADVGDFAPSSPAVRGYADGVLRVAATLKSRAIATLDRIDPEWRQVDAALAEMTGGTP